jgi:hypothetical protein
MTYSGRADTAHIRPWTTCRPGQGGGRGTSHRASARCGCVDGDDGVTEGSDAVACTGQEPRCLLVQAAAVPHQHQGRVLGAGCGRPEHAGDPAQGEVAFGDTVQRCLGSELQRIHRLLPFKSALLERRSRRHLRQSPDHASRGSTHIDLAFTGLTSSRPVTVCRTLPVGIHRGQPFSGKSTQSGHFKVLREAGLIRQRDEGTRRLNRLRRDDLDARFPGLIDLVTAQALDAKTDDPIEPPTP